MTAIRKTSPVPVAARKRTMIEDLNKQLLEAAESGDHERVLRLLGEGAEISSRHSNGDTGLHISAVKGHDKVMKTFVLFHWAE